LLVEIFHSAKHKREIEMKAYLATKYYEDFRNKSEIERISDILRLNGFDSFCVVRDHEKWGDVEYDAKELMRLTFQELAKCDFILIDLTEKGVGLGIEAGFAYAKGLPIVTMARSGSDISTTLRGISKRVFFYDSVEDITSCLNEIIKEIF
jgi:nucleoside 2-deoxyribosyltransferase